MGKPPRWRVALVLRVQFFDGDAVKPKRNIWIPLPLLFLLAFGVDVFACVVVHMASIVLPAFGKKRRRKLLERPLPLLRAATRIFFLTRLSYGVMRYGNALEFRVVDGASGIVVSVG
jgi:hypothetical protein